MKANSIEEIKDRPASESHGGGIRLLPEVSDDEMVLGRILEFENIAIDQAGNYTCVISNNYGTLRKTITISVGKHCGIR